MINCHCFEKKNYGRDDFQYYVSIIMLPRYAFASLIFVKAITSSFKTTEKIVFGPEMQKTKKKKDIVLHASDVQCFV